MTAHVHGTAAAPGKAPPNPWLVAVTVALTTFMEVLDISIANVALSYIAGDMAAGQDEATWVLTSYLVANAIVLPVSGWMSSVLGRRRFYMTCVALFTFSSFLCGIAPSLPMLIFFRVLQGAGGGGLQPSSQAILSDTFPPAQRGMAFAVYGVTTVVAPAIGPTLGGWLTDTLSWRWIFFINIPVGLLSMVLSSRLVWDPPQFTAQRHAMKARGFRVDYIGFGLLAVGFGFLQVVLDKGEREDWFSSPWILAMSVASATALVAMVWWESRQRDPMVDVRLLLNRNFAVANLLLFMLGFILLASTMLLPLMVQSLLGYTAMDSGMLLSPGGIAMLFLLPIIGMLVTRMDLRYLVVAGLCLTASSLIAMAHFDLSVDFTSLWVARMFQALGLGFLFIPINTAGFAEIPMAKSSNASAIINLSRNLGGSFGISVVSTLLLRRAQEHQAVLGAHVTSTSPNVVALLDGLKQGFMQQGMAAVDAAARAQAALYAMVQRQASMLAFIDAFWLLAVLFLAMIPFVFLLRRPKLAQAPSAAH